MLYVSMLMTVHLGAFSGSAHLPCLGIEHISDVKIVYLQDLYADKGPNLQVYLDAVQYVCINSNFFSYSGSKVPV